MRESPEQCRKGVVKMVTPVQRLVILLPAEDQPEELIEALTESLRAEELLQGGQHGVEPGPEMGTAPADVGDVPEVSQGSPGLGSESGVGDEGEGGALPPRLASRHPRQDSPPSG